MTMKVFIAVFTVLLLGSCATKVPYTQKIKKEFSLTPDKLKKVQFFTSETIILERSNQQGKVTTTGDEGTLVTSSESSSERIIIPANRPCIFEDMESDGSIKIRFETGAGRALEFSVRPNISDGRLYLKADWRNGKGALQYGGTRYFAVRGSASAYLLVKLKNFRKNRHSDRVVKGMKVK